MKHCRIAREALKINKDTDLLAKIDGIHVLAPGWKQCRTCAPNKRSYNLPISNKQAFIVRDMLLS